MEIFESSYACSPSALSGALSGVHGPAGLGTWAAVGRAGGVRAVAPASTTTQGTGVSIAMRDKTAVPAAATALLPISDVVVNDGFAGIRSWSPPV